MPERKFRLVHDYNITRNYHGIHIPKQWQAWETAHFFRVHTIIKHPEVPARLISYGCNNGDPNALNCTETCTNETFMYSSPENLWNCMTLATVAMVVRPGNDTIDRENEKEMDEIFHFGTVEKFNELGVFWHARRCVWASCADSTYGHCTASLGPFKCQKITPFNIKNFGQVMAGPYCQAANAGIDLDIAGQGIVTAYIIQLVLVLFLGLCFKLTTSWIRTFGRIVSSFQQDSSLREKCQEVQVRLSQTRFAHASSSAMRDFQESQALFAATISITAIITFDGGNKAGMANMLSLFSWMFNHRILQGLITAGMYPVLLAQLLCHRNFYTLFFVILSWILMAVITESQDFDTDAFEKHLKQVSTVPVCGNMPGPMSFCQGIKEKESYEFFPITLACRCVVHGVVSCLIIDYLVYFVKKSFWGDKATYKQLGGAAPPFFETKGARRGLGVFWVLVGALTSSMIFPTEEFRHGPLVSLLPWLSGFLL
ncbi:uncharacterized protein B0J16DRAFT_403186 [Fusarium flagelliforme]|uniref:uncharacterized protein n=1 Tax=Fusarium flagelliforme TaxID=2675880 RepID=UPI001E8E6929|nr:uncharacterized protein B0J16DRAFT_403186 [Fusarium flagelliforme]KAH7179872.1 hypothetical protein B0J16DRAFT_403186 [Fusarium flagelliforme]